MATPNPQPTADQAAIVKGKSPRNAILGVGAVAAIAIGGIGFYYQMKQSNQLAEEATLQRKAKAAEAVQRAPVANDEIDKAISDQISAARREAASAARPASAPRADNRPRPALTAEGFMRESEHDAPAGKTAEQNIYASPIFPPGVKQPEQQSQQQPNTLPNVPTPQQLAIAQAAAQQAAVATGNAQAQEAMKAAQGGGQTTQQRDTRFMNDARAQSTSGEGFLATGFVGQSRGCTLSPPSTIQVLSLGGMNSDRPGTADLVVEQDIYDSLGNGCLMIPKGSIVRTPYSSDIQPGQESILVAATELRLPNGKHVPLFGSQGTDADGTAGFSGDVNNHFLKIYGTSFLTAILLGAFDNNSATSTTTGPLGVTQVGSTAGQVAANTAQSVLSRYQNIPPTITVKPGQRFLIKVNRDITLEPYRD